MPNPRNVRQHEPSKPNDQRRNFEVDRDRLLYSSAFRRLAQVTQVVGAAEGNVFHNRLTHSLKVAQVARRVAEKLIRDAKSVWKVDQCLNADVVEAAALAHDLGHPPFGHIAEQELNKAAIAAGLSDGFEGNAQTFRILTLLEPHRTANYQGLNLTRATLDATLKYPWTKHSDASSKHSRKFSVYELDKNAFDFVRESVDDIHANVPCVEAKVMEFADDATYSVHDLEDFYLAGLIPLYPLAKSDSEFEKLINDWKQEIASIDPETAAEISEKETVVRLQGMLKFYVHNNKYAPGSADQLSQVRTESSSLLQRFVNSVSLEKKKGGILSLKRDKDRDLEMKFLHQLVRKFVIFNPRLASQQNGQRKIIKTLFDIYKDAIEGKNISLIPAKFLKNGSLDHLLESADLDCKQQCTRLAVDIVASMSEPGAVTIYRRLTGIEQGSVMDYIN
jgi:dGTPase